MQENIFNQYLKQLDPELPQDYLKGFKRGLLDRYLGFGDTSRPPGMNDPVNRHHYKQGYDAGYYGPGATPFVLRAWNDWSIEQLAIMVGRSPRTIEGWEQGRPIPEAARKTLELLRIRAAKRPVAEYYEKDGTCDVEQTG